MKIHKRSYVLVLLVILAGSGYFLFDRFLGRIEIEAKTRRYLKTLSQNIGGDIIFESSRLRYFPLPHLSIKNITYISPDNTRGTVNKIAIYARLLPLLSGNLQLSAIKIDSPDIRLNYYPRAFPVNIFPLSGLKPQVDHLFKVLSEKFPGIMIQVSQGNLGLNIRGKYPVYLTDINASVKLPSDHIAIVMDCKSSLWRDAHVNFRMYRTTYEGTGALDVTAFNVSDLPKDLFPTLSKRMPILSGDLSLSFTTTGFSELSGRARGLVSNMILHPKGQGPLPLRCRTFSGNFDLNQGRTRIQVDKMEMTEPDVILSGQYIADSNLPKVTLEVTAKKAQVAPVRRTALALVGRFRTTQRICDYVRDGFIPEITFKGSAADWKGFKYPEAIQLDGHITGGRVFIPAGKLDLKHADGDVGVYKGNLIGKNLSAVLGNSYGSEGAFSIGLHGKAAPFYLEVKVDADLAQLPPVLKKLIRQPKFQSEMDRIQNVRGRAKGKLILGDRRDRIQPTVKISEYEFSADYQRTPMTVSLAGKHLVYDNRQIKISDAEGTWGSSDFHQISAVFDWQGTPAFLWKFASARLHSEQIYDWLVTLDGFKENLNPPDKLVGTIALDRTLIAGPLFVPGQWDISSTGAAHRLTLIDIRRLPGPLSISGRITVEPEEVQLSQGELMLEDAHMAGNIKLAAPYNKAPSGAVGLAGTLGPDMLAWFGQKVQFPFEFHEDLESEVKNFDVSWEPNKGMTFCADVDTATHTTVFIDGSKTEDELKIRNLTVSDDQSDMVIALSKNGADMAIDFSGHLDGRSLTQVMCHRCLFDGLLSGEFQLGVNLEKWRAFSFAGKLAARDFSFPEQEKLPFLIHTLKLENMDRDYLLDSVVRFENEGPVRLSGTLFQSPEAFEYELRLDADALNLDPILTYIKSLTSEEKKARWALYDGPIRGDIYATAKELVYGKYTWSKVDADLRITPDAVVADISKADLCGIQTPGHLVVSHSELHMDFFPGAHRENIADSLTCLADKKGLIQGRYSLKGEIVGGNPFETFFQSIKGSYTLKAEKGRIYKLNLLSKIFAMLNITEIFRGKLPDLAQEGFAYESITADGRVDGTKVKIKNGFIDGASMGIVVKGEVDTREKTMDLSVLVAPLKTVDFIIQQTPLVKDLIKGAVVSIPIEIKGDMANPVVKTLAPADVDSGLLGIMKNTLKLPVTLIQPLLAPDDEKEK